MIGLMIHWDVAEVIARSQKANEKILKMYSHTAKAFDVTELIIIDKEEAAPLLGDTEIKTTYYENIDAALKNYNDCEIIYIDPDGANTYEYDHPKDNVVYIVGSDFSTFNIPDSATVVGFNSKFPVHATVAAGIVLSSR